MNDVSNVKKRPYLVVDDDETCLELLKYILLDYGDHIRFESSSTAALSYVENNEIKVLLTDHRMPTLSGLELIRRVKQLYPECYVVLMSSFDDYTEVITEFNNKLLDQYLSKPVSKPDLYNVMDRVRRNLRGQKEVYNYGFVSQNKNVLKLLEMVPRAAKSGLPVMIVGETGTGKELIAHAIHDHSARKEGEFLACSCPNLVPSLAESQLFGSVKGSFTGADRDSTGIFQQAKGGTIFLDELNSLDMAIQGKLLRVLETGKFSRLGDHAVLDFEGEIISAINLPVDQAVETGCLRADLKYRMDVVRISLPPLRERRDDVLLLFRHFAERLSRSLKCTDDVEQFLTHYDWPGNVRELENVVRYIIAMHDDEVVTRQHLPSYLQDSTLFGSDLPTHAGARKDLTKNDIISALKECNFNKSDAASALGVSRMTLWRKIKEHNL